MSSNIASYVYMTAILYIDYMQRFTIACQYMLYRSKLRPKDFQFLQEILYSQRRKILLLYSTHVLIWIACNEDQHPIPINESNKSICNGGFNEAFRITSSLPATSPTWQLCPFLLRVAAHKAQQVYLSG